ncbi:MAG: hypothetical protein WA936_06425 [Erythrobacter sp.]|uniref:hypothetical protein n=1 Tax=Erythrobacter sp. TaxID=1042 RepID=UPI003C796511
MSNLERRFREDKALRDAAKRNFFADIAQTRAGLSGTGIAGRVAGRVSEGARDVFDTAKDQADDNRGIVAALIGALVLWFGRGPILDLLGLSGEEDDEIAEDAAAYRDDYPPGREYRREYRREYDPARYDPAYEHEYPGDYHDYRNDR